MDFETTFLEMGSYYLIIMIIITVYFVNRLKIPQLLYYHTVIQGKETLEY